MKSISSLLVILFVLFPCCSDHGIDVPQGGDPGRGTMMVRNNMFNYWYSGHSDSYYWQIGYATSPLVPLEVSEPPRELPNDFMLGHAFPNPFNPETTIEYAVAGDARVTIKVFDALGQEVATLVDQHMIAGTYSTTWNAQDIASGVYWYRMTAGGFSDTKKVIVLK